MISVCIATYNGEPYIGQQLSSILPQLSEADEVIISDDGSTDATLDVVRAFADARIRITQGPQTGSAVDNFEHALALAQGDIIYLSDQDDCWMPDKLQRMNAVLEAGEADCVLSDCVLTDAELRPTHPSFFACNGTRHGRYYNLLIKNGYIGGCMAFRRSVLQRALPFPSHLPMHDLWIGNVAAFFFRLKFIDEPLSYFRRSGHNVSTSGSKSSNSLCRKLSMRLRVVTSLLCRLLSKR